MTAPPPPEVPPIEATLFLVGGHREVIRRPPGDPVWTALSEAILTDPPRGLVRVLLDDGRELVIRSRDVVGVAARPPFLPDDPTRAPPGVVRFTGVLPQAERDALFKTALSMEQKFVESSTEGADDYRKSLVVYDAEKFAVSLLYRIRELVPEVCRRLGMPPLEGGGRVELQLTAHNDGHFYKVHNDNDGVDAAARELTFVYYLHGSPKGFSGGELVVYEREGRHGIKLGPGQPGLVEPDDNTLVFFRAGRLHEVLPVICPSKAFADSRFTLNGWVWR